MSVWRDRVYRLASIASVAVILSACIGALEFVVTMRESEFGFVLIDKESDKTLMH